MPLFLHAADLHLDSPLGGLEKKARAPVERIRTASRRALQRLVDRALERRVAFALFAGDVYDAQPAFETYLFFHRQLARLSDAGIPVAIVLGNHDHGGIAPRAGRLPKNVRQLSHEQAESWELVPGVVVHGRSYPRRDVTEDLRPSYPAPVPAKLNIGLLHTALAGHESGHATYAPTTLPALAGHGFQYWALGHVHRHLALVEGGVHVVFPGNLQGRHARETGPKGAVFVEYEGARVQRVTHEAFDDVRWEHLVIDAATLPQEADPVPPLRERLLETTREVRDAGGLVAVRLTLRGEAPRRLLELGETELRETLLLQLDDVDGLFLEKLELDVRPRQLDRTEAERQLLELVGRLKEGDQERRALGQCVEGVRRKLSDTDLALTEPGVFPGRRGEPPTEPEAEALLHDALGLVRELLHGTLVRR